MPRCTIEPEKIQETIQFHGHSCPGLALGIRVSEWLLQQADRAPDEEIVALVETDMCAVDAIQYLTGCTYGKGNLIHLDFGKNAFTFFHRSEGKASRLVTKPEVFDRSRDDLIPLQKKKMLGEPLTAEEEGRLAEARASRTRGIMEADLEDLFVMEPYTGPVPKRARILESVACDACGENTMETRTRRFAGHSLCIPCFDARENRL